MVDFCQPLHSCTPLSKSGDAMNVQKLGCKHPSHTFKQHQSQRHEHSATTWAIPMSKWMRTPDGQAAQELIKNEIKTQAWDKLSNASSRADKDTGKAQRRHFSMHLQSQYPLAGKSPDAWVHFIQDITGKVKKRTISSAEYKQASDQPRVKAMTDARLQFKAGKHLTPDAREAQGLTLTPVQEKPLEPYVTVLIV